MSIQKERANMQKAIDKVRKSILTATCIECETIDACTFQVSFIDSYHGHWVVVEVKVYAKSVKISRQL